MPFEVIGFFALSTLLLVLGVAAFYMVGLERLTGSAGIQRDGPRVGEPGPVWSLKDLSGTVRSVPDGRWKTLLFVDHAIRSFDDLTEGLSSLADEMQADGDLLIVSSGNPALMLHTSEALGISVPIVAVEPAFDAWHRVRVWPYAIVIDPEGVVRNKGLASSKSRLLTVWRTGRLHETPTTRSARGAEAVA